MDILPLNPLPAETSESAKGSRQLQSEGFVDEAVVRSVLMKGAYERVYVKPEEMVLSSSEEDYAGWALPVSSPFRDLIDEQAPSVSAEIRQPAAPSLKSERAAAAASEAGISEPYTGAHRWWLFGISGAMTCAILSLTLLSLAQRGNSRDLAEGHVPATLSVTPESAEQLTTKSPAIQRALTSFISSK